VASSTALEDTTAPQIEYYYITLGDYINSSKEILVYAKDNISLKNVKIEISQNGLDDWQIIASQDYTNIKDTNFEFKIFKEVENFADGEYNLRATETDYSDLTSSVSISVNLDNTPPAAAVLTAESIIGGIKLTYSKPSDDVMYYELYRAEVGTEFTDVVHKTIYDLDQLTWTEIDYTKIGQEYKYKIVAVDRAGNKGEASNIASAVIGNYRPSIGIEPTETYPGDEIIISVSGFRPYETLYFYVDNEQFTSCSADSEGAVQQSYKIPAGLTGIHSFKVQGKDSNVRAVMNYTILEKTPVIEVSNSTPKAGELINITASGFIKSDYDSYEYVDLYINNNWQNTLYTSTGIYTYNY